MSMKKCFIKNCANTSINSAHKIFITVPKPMNIRTLWYQTVNDCGPIPSGAAIFCCEDHFNLKTDAENWQYFKTMGQRIRLKSGVVPHRNILCASSATSQLSPSSKKRKSEVLQGLKEHPSVRRKLHDDPKPSTSQEDESEKLSSPSGKFVVFPSPEKMLPSVSSRSLDKSIMVKPQMKTKFTSTKLHSEDKAVNTIKLKITEPVRTGHESQGNTSDSISISDAASQVSTFSGGSSTVNRKTNEEVVEICKLENNSRFYLGLPEDCYFLINLIIEESRLYHTDVMITLKKIRTNDQFSRIGIDFGKSTSQISKVFNKTVPIMATLMQQLIIWPPSWKIKKLLPNQFKAYYSNVQAIIDCFEIEVEKPSNALHQALTWSEYKKCNTIKYLVACTPNGLINFISCGFGGRATDVQIVENSNFLTVLPENSIIMADRGFKQIESILNSKNSKLLRPPSVSAKQKPSKHEVRYGKIISALRVHIERLIRRLREFAMLKPHACIRSRIVHLLDSVVIIACGLVNLQGRLLKY